MIRPLVQYRDHEDCVRRAATLAGLPDGVRRRTEIDGNFAVAIIEYDPARAPTVAQYLRGEAPK
jgi:hypothetical protein